MNRLQAIRAVRSGSIISKRFFGHEVIYGRRHMYEIIIAGKVTMVKDYTMHERYVVSTKAKDVLAFIRKNYKR